MNLVTEVTPKDQLWARADEIARTIAGFQPVAIQGSVRAIWEALSMPRDTAVANAFKYCQIGNPISMAAIDRANMPKTKYTLR